MYSQLQNYYYKPSKRLLGVTNVTSVALFNLWPKHLLTEGKIFKNVLPLVWLLKIINGNQGLPMSYIVAPSTSFFFFLNFLEDMSPFCGATDTPVYGLLVMSPLGFKARVGSALFELSRGICVTLHVPWDSPLVWHLLTSWRPAWQLSCLHIPVRHWWDSKPGAIMLPLTVWDQADALPTELSRLGKPRPTNIVHISPFNKFRFLRLKCWFSVLFFSVKVMVFRGIKGTICTNLLHTQKIPKENPWSNCISNSV